MTVGFDVAADKWFYDACSLCGASPECTALVTSAGYEVLPEDTLASLDLGSGSVFHLVSVQG